MATHKLETAEADIVYDVHGPVPTADGRSPLFMIGQPMDASDFSTLASCFPDRTVVTYDPRGIGRSAGKDGRVDNVPQVQAQDVHAVIGALGAGPLEMFAGSGGAVTALALVAAYLNDVTTLVAHEPPILPVLPDAEAARRARAAVRNAYEARGWGTGLAAFIGMTSWRESSPTTTSPCLLRIPPNSACRLRTTGPVTTRCYRTDLGRSAAIVLTSRHWPGRRRAS